MSVPDNHRVDHKLTEEEIIFCGKSEKLLCNDMKQLMPTCSDGKEEHLYIFPLRNKLFLQKNSISPIYAARYATTDMDHVLGLHVDIHNPKIHYSISNSFLNQQVSCFAKKRGQICRLLIGFCRYFVVNTAIYYGKFGTCLESITMFNNKLAGDKFDITTTLVENLNNEVKDKGSICHFPDNFSK